MNTIGQLLAYKGIFIADARRASKLTSSELKPILPQAMDVFELPSLAMKRIDQFVTISRRLSPDHIAYARKLKGGLR